MNRKSFFAFALLAPILLSCSSEGGPLGSPVYTVDFVDDEGTSVGYAYVIEGKRAIYKSNDGSEAYDFLPRAKKREEGNNASYYVFDGWKGEYDPSFQEDDPSIDINNIRHDCTLRATFRLETYRLLATFRSEMNVLGFTSYEDRSIAYKDGVSTSFPVTLREGECLVPYDFLDEPSYREEHRFYYEKVDFKGWNILDASGESDVYNPSYSSNSFLFSLRTEEWGREEAPSIDPTDLSGTLLLNSSYNEKGQPDYPAYFSNGKSWVSLGLLSRTPTLYLDAAYTKSNRSFELKVFPSKADAENAVHEVAFPEMLILPYGTRLEITQNDIGEDVLLYGEDNNNDRVFDEEPNSIILPLTSPIGEWMGFCYGFSDFGGMIPSYVDEEGRSPLSFDHLISNASIYPLNAMEEL